MPHRARRGPQRGGCILDALEIFLSQIRDPFRIGLMIAMVYTMLRTRAVTGTWLPLAAGTLFVAAIIPLTMAPAAGTALVRAISVGLITNLVILLAIMAAMAVWSRFRG